MSRRQITRSAHDATHKRLMLSVRHSRGPARVAAVRELRAYIVAQLRAGK